MTSDKADLKGKHAFAGIFSVFAKLKDHPLMLAFLLNFAAFMFRIIFFDVKYEVSDDFFIDAVLSGAFGNGYDPDLLFGNIILGYVLVFFYKIFPMISFYFVLLLLLGFLSVTAILFILFKKKINAVTVCMAVVFLCFLTDDMYVVIQFTKVSAAAGVAGGLLILFGLWEAKEHKLLYIVLGALLSLDGTMVRFSTIYIFAAFLVIAFINYAVVYLFSKDKDKRPVSFKKGALAVLRRFLVCVFIIGLFFGVQYFGAWLANLDNGHREYHVFNPIRSRITDTNRPDYEEVSEAYKNIGLNKVDYTMIDSWNFNDRGVYSDECLKKLNGINNHSDVKATPSIGDALGVLVTRCVMLYPAALALYIFVLLALLLDRNKIFPLVMILSVIAYLFFFVYYGRITYRVEWGIFYSAVSCVAAGFNYDEKCSLAVRKIDASGIKISVLPLFSVILVAFLLVMRIPRTIKSFSYYGYSDEEYRTVFLDSLFYSNIYVPDKVIIPTVRRKPHPNLIKYIENDTEHYYYIDAYTTIQEMYFNYSPWLRIKQGLFRDSYIYMGAVTMHHPGEVYALSANGCDPYNPFKNLTDKKVYFVDNLQAAYKLAYVKQNYYPDADIELVKEVDGYLIWNMYIPSGK